MQFFYLSRERITDAFIKPHKPFYGLQDEEKVTYIPVTKTIHQSCQLMYHDIKDDLVKFGHVKLFVYKVNLDREDRKMLHTPERMEYEETCKYAKILGECRITSGFRAAFVGHVIVLSPNETALSRMLTYKHEGESIVLSPTHLDHYLVRRTFSNDTSALVTKKLFPQFGLEIRYISQGYDDICIEFCSVLDYIVPIVLQRGMTTGARKFLPSISFICTEDGKKILAQYFEEVKKVLPEYGLKREHLIMVEGVAKFKQSATDHRGKEIRVGDTSDKIHTIAYHDFAVLDDNVLLDNIRDAFYEAALVMFL